MKILLAQMRYKEYGNIFLKVGGAGKMHLFLLTNPVDPIVSIAQGQANVQSHAVNEKGRHVLGNFKISLKQQ